MLHLVDKSGDGAGPYVGDRRLFHIWRHRLVLLSGFFFTAEDSFKTAWVSILYFLLELFVDFLLESLNQLFGLEVVFVLPADDEAHVLLTSGIDRSYGTFVSVFILMVVLR